MANETTFTVRLTQEEDYRFRVTFDSPEIAALLVDEPAPLGKNEGPSAARLVAAAVASCLSASLRFVDFCIVTQSIRQGIPVHVAVKDAAGRVVHQG